MKQKKQLFILLVALAVTASLTLILSFAQSVQAGEDEDQADMVVDLSMGEVQALILKNESGSIALLNLPTGIELEGADTDDYDQDKLKALIFTLSHLTARRTLTGTGDSLEAFGLETPLAQVSILAGDDVIRMSLGRKCPVSEEHYLRLEGDEAVYLIDGETAGRMLDPVLDLRKLDPYPSLTNDALKNLTRVTIIQPDGKITLRRLRSDTVSVFFTMLEPVVTGLDWKRVDERVVTPLRELHPDHFVSDDIPLSYYGLDSPAYILELELAGDIYRCGFSPKNQDTWYCADLNTSLVSQVSRERAAFLETDFMDLIGNSIYSKSVADLEHISAKYGDKTISMEIAGESTSLVATVGQRQLDYLEVVDFYNRIDTIPAASLLRGDEDMAARPELTLSIFLRDGQTDILEFHKISDRQCAVFINGTAEFSTYSTVVKDLIQAFDSL